MGQITTIPTKNPGDLDLSTEVNTIVTEHNDTDTRLASAETNITTLDGRVTTLEGQGIYTVVNITADYDLPASSGFVGVLRLVNRSGSDWTVTRDGADTIEGLSTQTIYDGETFDLFLNGTNWTL